MTKIALILLLGLSGCAGFQVTVGTDASCRAFKTISYSRTDTTETRRQVRGHNAAWRSICESD